MTPVPTGVVLVGAGVVVLEAAAITNEYTAEEF